MADTAAPSKVTQAKAHYQDKPQDGEMCSECDMFMPPKGCTAVNGDVSPSGWCSLYTEKPEPDTAEATEAAAGPRLGNVMAGGGGQGGQGY